MFSFGLWERKKRGTSTSHGWGGESEQGDWVSEWRNKLEISVRVAGMHYVCVRSSCLDKEEINYINFGLMLITNLIKSILKMLEGVEQSRDGDV